MKIRQAETLVAANRSTAEMGPEDRRRKRPAGGRTRFPSKTGSNGDDKGQRVLPLIGGILPVIGGLSVTVVLD